jgi:REP element-mobilizing transposase RayT
MANTFTQIHIHVVFTVQDRACVIRNEWKEDLYRYITGIIQKHGHKVLAINGMPDHIHILIGMRPTQSLSDLMQMVKGDSSKWINSHQKVRGHFTWQEGYGAFSYSKSQVPTVIEYIRNQEQHHRARTFLDEYREILTKFEVEFDERFVFKSVDYMVEDI